MRLASKTGLRKSARQARKKTGTEIEVKLRIPEGRQILGQLRQLEAQLTAARVHEMNTLYDTPDGKLARHGRILRLRVELPAPADAAGQAKASDESSKISALLTYKGPAKGVRARRPERYKVREEHETLLSDYEEMLRILEALGMRPWFRYEKFRSTFKLPRMRLKVTFDETPIGLFLELEGERDHIDRAARLLGFSTSDYINKSYGALFMEKHGLSSRAPHNEPTPSCGLPDMLFRS